MRKILILLTLFAVLGCRPAKTGEPDPGPADKPPDRPPAEDPPPIGPVQPGHLNLDQVEDAILSDLQNLNGQTRINTRYLIGCNFYNAGLRAEDLQTIKQGTDKGINGVSQERFLEPTTSIGPGDCVYRIDLRDYGITTTEWRKVDVNSVLQFQLRSIRGQNIAFLTQAVRPYLFTTDFMLTAYEADSLTDKDCDIYCDLTEQPADLADFFTNLGVDPQREVDDENAVFAGFSESQIALQKTRGVMVIETADGFCFTTFDSGLNDEQNIFVTPFSVELANAQGVFRTNKVYDFNAQEHICTLPNGLMMLYRLNGAAGIAESKAPNDVVVNIEGSRIDPTIRLGDCSNCHSGQAIIPIRDQVREFVLENAGFNTTEKELAEVFFNSIKMEGIITRANNLHRQRLTQLGIGESQDPLVRGVMWPLRQEMNAKDVASYTFLPEDEFMERLEGASQSSQVFGNLLNNGTVSLGTLQAGFPTLVVELNLFDDRGEL